MCRIGRRRQTVRRTVVQARRTAIRLWQLTQTSSPRSPWIYAAQTSGGVYRCPARMGARGVCARRSLLRPAPGVLRRGPGDAGALHAATATLPYLRTGLSVDRQRGRAASAHADAAAAVALADRRAAACLRRRRRRSSRGRRYVLRSARRWRRGRARCGRGPLRHPGLPVWRWPSSRRSSLPANGSDRSLRCTAAGGGSHRTTRTVAEAASLVSAQLELAELEQQSERLANAELRALRAQISPHFIYNALAAIAGYIRTKPEEARELLDGVRRIHALRVPRPAPLCHARRRALIRREVSAARAGPVR